MTEMRDDSDRPVVSLRGIGKSFGPVSVLRNINLDVFAGEILVLLGENGAGKSTLIKIVDGVYKPDAGQLLIGGEEVRFGSVHEAESAGISTIHQELSLADHLSVAENVLMAGLPNRLGVVDRRELKRRAARAVQRVGLTVPVETPVAELSVAQKQLVEIAKALAVDARILILDEPTAALTGSESERLFAIMEDLRSHGVAMIYISHHLEEVSRVGDRVAVLRDGNLIDVVAADTPEDRLVEMMVGRAIQNHYPRRREWAGPPTAILQVRELTSGQRVRDVSLEVGAGEVVGIAGMAGAGRNELLRAIIGADRYQSGAVIVNGTALRPGKISGAIGRRIGYVPEDRKREGLVLVASTSDNLGLATLRATSRLGLADLKGQRQRAAQIANRLSIRVSKLDDPVRNLSGGNQQKCVFGRWALAGTNLLLLDEPTRGVDVGARVEIYEFINELTASGGGVLMVSSDLPELLGMSDRVLVMNSGRIVGELTGDAATQEAVMNLAVRDVAQAGGRSADEHTTSQEGRVQ